MRCAALAAWLIAVSPALAEAPATTAAPSGSPVLSLSGHLARPRSFSAADLAKLPVVASDQSSAGPHWSGVLLWPLLDQAGWVDQPGRKTHMQHVILARGRDGYTVALSIAELDPALEGKQVMVASTRNGKPLPDLELVVPGDKRGARHVHDLVGVEAQ